MQYLNLSLGAPVEIASYVGKAGKEEPRRYLIGKVVGLGDAPLDVRKVNVMFESLLKEPRSLTLPAGTMPPAIGTQFVGVLKNPHELSYFQEVDGVTQKLLMTKLDGSATERLHLGAEKEAAAQSRASRP